ncbi:shikimate dehydrogenase [Planctomycetota bacterium]
MAESPNFLHQITGSFAKPAAENPTVEMIEAAFQHHGLHWRYINLEVGPENLGDAVKGARAMGWCGFNCSLPNKVEVIPYLDGLGESAAIIGAVNCAVRREGQFIGENTDGKGFLASLKEKTDPSGKSMVLLGAGGAARAIGVEVALAGAANVTVVNRDVTRGKELVTLLNDKTPTTAQFVQWDGVYQIPSGTDVVVNATSVGLYPDVDAKLSIDIASLSPAMVVADVIPNPLETNLTKDARARGCTVINGLGMLVNQGVISIKYWTGVDVEPEPMRARVCEVLGM